MRKILQSFFNDFSLRRKLTILYTIIFTVLFLSLGFFTYTVSIRKIAEREKVLLYQNLVLKGEGIKTFFDTLQRKIDDLFTNQLLQEVLTANYEEMEMLDAVLAYEDVIYKTVNPVFEDLSGLSYSISNFSGPSLKIIIYPLNTTLPADGRTVKEFKTIRDEAWVAELLMNTDKIKWQSYINDDKGLPCISASRVMKDFSTREVIGIIRILVPQENIRNMLSSTADKESTLWLKTENGLIGTDYHGIDVPNSIYALIDNPRDVTDSMHIEKLDGKNVLYGAIPMPINDWEIISLSPYNEIRKRLRPIQLGTLLFLVIGLIVSELVILVISRKIGSRIELMNQKFSNIQKDRYTPMTPIGGRDEIGQLDNSFLTMISELNKLVDKEKDWEVEKNHLTLELLQAQINPHLLYNTLATIEWKAKKRQIDEVQGITRKLISFFRYYLNNGALIAPVSEELTMLKEYIEIFLFTYQLDVEAEFQIEEGLHPYYSIKLFLQPIVENALHHGLRPINKTRKGHIAVKAKRAGKNLVFQVEDNGMGMSQETLEQLDKGIPFSRHGFGILNVKKRIALYFGPEYGISITSQEHLGTQVSISIPACYEEDMNAIINV